MLKKFFDKDTFCFSDTSQEKFIQFAETSGKIIEVEKNVNKFAEVINDFSAIFFITQGEIFVESIGKTFRYNEGSMLLNFLLMPKPNITIVSSVQALQIKKDELYTFLRQEPQLCNEFNQCSAHVMSSYQNQDLTDLYDINELISLLKVKLSGEIYSSTVLGKIAHSKTSIDKTGAQLITNMMKILNDVKELKNVDSTADVSTKDETQKQIDLLQGKLMGMITNEPQNFDIISQQLHAIERDLQHILAYVEEKAPIDIGGDKNIFSVKLVREEQDDYGDMDVF